MRLFKRVAKVTVVALAPDNFTRTAGNAIEIETMRIQFDVKKNLGKHPNKCTIKLTNLSPTTRALLDRKPLRVVLHAGFDGAPRLLFDGDMRRSFSERVGRKDLVTEIHVGDGDRSTSFARLDKTYKAPVSLRQVISDAARQMNLPVPREVSRLTDTLPDALSLSGTVGQILTRLLTPLGYSWSMQNSQLTILRAQDVRDGQEFLVNQSTGLINSPKIKESEHTGKGAKTELTFQTLLYPELNPGSVAVVQSEFLNQRVKITDCASKGDTESNSADWETSVTGVPL